MWPLRVLTMAGGRPRGPPSPNGEVATMSKPSSRNVGAFGQRLLRFWEGVLSRIPVVKSVYYSVKQVSDTLFSSSGEAFRKALLVQYPREGIWTIAFQTGQPGGDVVNYLDGEYVSIYVPTTPNPTSGFFLMLPRKDVIELDMSVDEALKYIISMGVVAPPMRNPAGRAQNQ